jgi:L-fuconolactonase
MYGSDWPVCLQAGTYNQVFNALLSALPEGLSNNSLDSIFGENSLNFYKIKNTGR